MLALDLNKISKKYAEHAVLNDISLELVTGEMFGLIGLNGAGKTSLIKCILDLQQPDSGSINIFGKASSEKDSRKSVVYLAEKFNSPDYMTGIDYLRFILNGHDLNHDSVVNDLQHLKTISSKLELNYEALEAPVKSYSKGMHQKLGIIGCLLSDKQFFIMDEPMSGLDPKARALFKNIISDLKNDNKTLLMCTHILADVELLCDRIGVLHNGQLLFIGSPKECCDQYEATNLEEAFLKCIQ